MHANDPAILKKFQQFVDTLTLEELSEWFDFDREWLSIEIDNHARDRAVSLGYVFPEE